LKKAEENYKKALNYVIQHQGKMNFIYRNTYKLFANLYMKQGRYDLQLICIEECLKITQELVGINSLDYAELLLQLAYYYKDTNSEKFNEIMRMKLSIEQNILGRENVNIIPSLIGLEFYDEAIEILESKNLIYNFHYLNALQQKSSKLARQNKVNEANQSYQKYIEILNKNIIFTLMNLSEINKKGILDKTQFSLNYIKLIQYYYSILNPNINFVTQIYNSELIFKGLLTSTGTLVRKQIMHSNNKLIIEKLSGFIEQRKNIENYLQKPINEHPINFKEILVENERLESELIKESQMFKKVSNYWKIPVSDVGQRLNNNDVAIEFVSFNTLYANQLSDTTKFAALMLQPNNEKPIWINLCTQQQIDSLWQVSKQGEVNNTINQFYNNPKLYELIWKPLEQHLVGVSKIYFAPAGGLHKIAFQALTGSDGEKLSKKYDLIQLTSTRELMDKELYTVSSTASFALFGGINYNADSTQLIQNKANFTNNEISYTINTRDSKKEKFSKLQFTDNEVKGIASLFNSKANQLFTGNAATEEQFKLLGSYTKPSPTIIHLATHGFYFDETNVDKRSLEEQTFEDIGKKSNRFKESINPLLRSGLVMAGANHVWQGKPPYKGLEDGILTAQEIANLNLSNTKLVVLSACESGLGDIKNNNEGVYGLQRAFKMAGVEYLLVSLWSVDDFTTQKMMRLFYSNLKTGLSIEESYKSMVENIKKQYPDEPFKWASFVLIK
jgi:CHAT domain-containing protein